MMKTRILIGIIFTITSHSVIKCQETPFLNYYNDFPSLYNSAATGMMHTIKIAANMRLDSVGGSGSPKSMIGLAEGGMNIGNFRVGAGLVYSGVKTGYDNIMGIYANLAIGYHFGNAMISVGISPGILKDKFNIQVNSNPLPDIDEELTDSQIIPNYNEIDSRVVSKVSTFDLGSGIFFTYNDLWLSLSGLHLFNPKYQLKKVGYVDGEADYSRDEKITAALRTIYFSGSYNITLKKSLFDLEPSFIFGMRSKNTLYQATARLKYRKLAFLGVGWRSKKSGTIIAGLEYGGFHLSYSYNHGFASSLDGYHLKGHEIMAWYSKSFDLKSKKKYNKKSVRIL